MIWQFVQKLDDRTFRCRNRQRLIPLPPRQWAQSGILERLNALVAGVIWNERREDSLVQIVSKERCAVAVDEPLVEWQRGESTRRLRRPMEMNLGTALREIMGIALQFKGRSATEGKAMAPRSVWSDMTTCCQLSCPRGRR